MLSGKAVKVTGVITYNFTDPLKPSQITVVPGETTPEPPAPPTPAELRLLHRKERLHVWLYELIDRLERKRPPGRNESRFVRDGKAELKITLATPSAEVLGRLKAAGFEVSTHKAGTLLGRIAIEKLAVLADIDEIGLILPKADQ
jgi:hypothetical protein